MQFQLRSRADKLVQSLIFQLAFDVTRHEVKIPHLTRAFQGFKIVQISDLHIDRWNTWMVDAAIEPINAMKPDLIVCTGDTIANGNQYLPEVIQLLRRLQARHGKLACLGNHDYSDWSGSRGVRRAFRESGFDVLVNESTTLTVQHQQLQLAGVDDLILGKPCLHTVGRRLDPEKPLVMLSHNPESFDRLSHLKPGLVLSGHTHGGQIAAPAWLHRHVFRSPYVAGWYQHQDSRLYVNRGLGSAVFIHYKDGKRYSIPTPRLAVQPEISVFTLTQTSTAAWLPAEPVRTIAS